MEIYFLHGIKKINPEEIVGHPMKYFKGQLKEDIRTGGVTKVSITYLQLCNLCIVKQVMCANLHDLLLELGGRFFILG